MVALVTLPLHLACVSVHVPSSWQVRVADPVRMYPLSQENRQVFPGRLEQGCKLPFEGTDKWAQRLTEIEIKQQKITFFDLKLLSINPSHNCVSQLWKVSPPRTQATLRCYQMEHTFNIEKTYSKLEGSNDKLVKIWIDFSLPPWQVKGSPGFSSTPSGQKHWCPLGFGRQRWLQPPFKCEQLVDPTRQGKWS